MKKFFQSFVNYFQKHELLDIQLSNIEEYEKLKEEFSIPSISEIIQNKRESVNKFTAAIESLKDQNSENKSEIEHSIANSFDEHLQNFREKILDVPVNSLWNILSYKDCNFSLHNLFD